MKKITAFFMALLPIIMMVLLFAAGIIVKNSTHVYVQSVELPDKSLVVQKSDETKDKTVTLSARVLPLNATNPDLYWTSSNENILTVNNKGEVACKTYGEAYVYATSKENQTLSASCKIEVNDKDIHNIIISDADKYDLGYIGLNERKQIKTSIVPATGVVDTTIDYDLDDESKKYISVTPDGLILPIAKTPTNTKATIKMHPHSGGYTSRVTTIDVQVGPGVEQMCLKDSTQAMTSSNTYDMYEQINTYPETNVSKTDYTYQSSDENVATIDENGIATFKRNGLVKLTATYKRNNTMTVSKEVYSTCNSLLDVNFNVDKYTQNIEYKNNQYVPADLDSKQIYCEVYPKAETKSSKYTVVSSDPTIVSTTKQDDGSYKFTALRPGVVMLYAYTQNDTNNVVDACYVTITSTDGTGKDAGLIKENTVTLTPGVFYYPLINSLNLQTDKRTPYDISYEFVPGNDVAYFDENNSDILHFTKAGTAVIKVKIGTKESGAITVIASDNTTELDIKDTLVVNVGQRYKLKNASAIFSGKEYENKFDVDSDTWSAKEGCKIENFEITTSNGENKTITLIVRQDPVYISNPVEAFSVTTNTEYNYRQEAGITIVPSTATKQDGTPYTLNYSYDFSNDSIKVEDDVINFANVGLAQIKTTIDGTKISLNSWLKSTRGKLNKFKVYNGTEEVISNSDVTYDGTDLVFTINASSTLEAEQFKCEVISGSELCDIETKVIEEPSVYVQFTIKPKSTLYGTETIAFTNNDTYSVYLNIKVPAVVTDVDVMYGRETLSTLETINSYEDKLTLNIIPYPALSYITEEGSDAYSVKLGEETLPVTNNQVVVDLTKGTELKIYAKDSSEPLKTYNFKKDDWSNLKISMIGADKDNNLYMGSKETKKVLYLKANGLVPLDFFQTDDFKVELVDKKYSEVAQMQQDILTITNMPSPDGSEYSLKIKLLYKTKELGTFTLTRDMVSKIVLPNHDNADMTDKKGLQKVHVYGNKSYYNDTEKQIEGYRLPIEVYDYKGTLITNTTEQPDLKAKAIKSLNLSINKNCSASYDEKNDCILVKFDNNTLYHENEIAQNLFDSKNGAKNVTFNVATKSNIANAKYTFVAVDGTNVYCQEGIANASGLNRKHGDGTVILQTNFGASGIEKDNVKFELNLDCVSGVYGNGYTIGMTYQAEHTMSSFYLGIHFAFNTIFEGCSDQFYQTLTSNTDHRITLRNLDHYKNGYFMYSIYKNFSNGISFQLKLDPQPATFKNSLFFNNKVTALVNDSDDGDAFIENCVLFDCGGLPCTNSKGGFHFKGYVGIYNFHNKEAFKDVFGYDLTSLWSIVEPAAKLNNMSEIGADGRTYINFFMATAMTDKMYFWNSKTQQYEKGEAGTPDAANFIAKFIDIKIPFTSINAALWATYNKTVDPSAFSYYDEYDKDGKIRTDFLAAQMSKLVRKPIYF